jgi:iron complex outermembrane receptor protein
MKRVKPRIFVKSAIALAVVNACLSQSVYAEETTTSAKEEEIERIIVTSTKRATTIQASTVAITSISGVQLAELGIQSSVDLVKIAPGLKVSWQGPNTSFKMRGGGVAGLNGPAVPLYTNGLSGGNSWAGWLDVQQLEILRGPQGTLYGANTLGGLVNIMFNKPDTEEFEFGGAATVGDYGLLKTEGFVNVPLTNQLAVRVTGSKTSQDPLIENTVNPDGGLRDENNHYVRAQLLWEPSDELNVNLEYTLFDNDSMGNANYGYHYVGIPMNSETGRTSGFGDTIDNRVGTTDNRFEGGRGYHNDSPASDPTAYYSLKGGFPNVWAAKTETFSLEANMDVGIGDVTLKARHTESESHNFWDVDGNEVKDIFDGNYDTSQSNQIDVFLTSKSDQALRWGVGLYWYDAWDPEENNGAYIWGYTDTSLDEATFPAWTYWDQGGSKSKAVYANAEYDLNEDLTISAGIRHQKDSAHAQRFYSNYYGDKSVWGDGYSTSGSPLLDASYYTETDDAKNSNEIKDKGHTDFKLAFNYAVNDNINLYGSVGSGYIAHAVSHTNVLDPNELDAYELGFKSVLLDNTLKLNVAYYNSEYSGLSYTVYESAGASITSRQETGGSLSSNGLEIDLNWTPIEGLIINAGLVLDDTVLEDYQLTESRFREGLYNEEGGYTPVNISTHETKQQWTADGDESRPVAPPTYDLSGKKASYSPEYIVNLDVSYYLDLADMGSVIPGVTLYHQDEFKTMNEEFAFAKEDGYTTIDMRVVWETPVENLSVKFYVNNLTDELYKVSQNVFSGGRIMADYGRQRIWGLRVGYNF